MAAKKPAKAPAPKPAAPPAAMTNTPPEKRIDWRDPDAKFAADDESLEARMWRLGQR